MVGPLGTAWDRLGPDKFFSPRRKGEEISRETGEMGSDQGRTARQIKIKRKARDPRPHPGPLPKGEGETVSALVAWSMRQRSGGGAGNGVLECWSNGELERWGTGIEDEDEDDAGLGGWKWE
jgi:hypothetical protein